MRTESSPNAGVEAAFAQPLTEELLAGSGITPGMRVVVMGSNLADLALLVAERVGGDGTVIGIDADLSNVECAWQRAWAEGFDRMDLRVGRVHDLYVDGPVDAVIGRFYLMRDRDPAEAIRSAARLVREGGRIVFQEWHYDSILWSQTSDWPDVPLFRHFAHWLIATMRAAGVHVDMGLRLVNLFSEAGLPLPSVRTDLRVIHGSGSLGYAFFESAVRGLMPAIQGRRTSPKEHFDADRFAKRLERETVAAGGHLFLPLQIGAWTRLNGPTRS
jgi:ubiquinone/menaquinone biosynthesis C-methylase UbiE